MAEGEVGEEGVDHVLIDLGLHLILLLLQIMVNFFPALRLHDLPPNLFGRLTLSDTLLQFHSILLFAFSLKIFLIFSLEPVILVELHVIEHLAYDAFQFLIELPLGPEPFGQYFLIDLESHLVYGLFDLIADEPELCIIKILRCSAL